MNTQHSEGELIYSGSIPILDIDFDSFDLNSDFKMGLRDAEAANFYHNALNDEELV